MSPTCNVCDATLKGPAYESLNGSLTSLCRLTEGRTRVYACAACGHAQSDALPDSAAYYENDYTILTNSEEEDQVYEVRSGTPVYRTDHQLATLVDKMKLADGLRILDYGCAKSSTMRLLRGARPELDIHLFDVSDRYRVFWERFAHPGNWAVHETPKAWEGSFDVITSFFALEHIDTPMDAMRTISALLKSNGRFYCVVPNVLANIADYVVADHPNHFTPASMAHLLRRSGLSVLSIDTSAHHGALVVVAKKAAANESDPKSAQSVAEAEAALKDIASFWNTAGDRVREFEQTLHAENHAAIYGAGFYAAFITSQLQSADRIECYVDQNPFLQGTLFNNKPVVAPSGLSESVDTLLVGLNPARARQSIDEIDAFKRRRLRTLFL